MAKEVIMPALGMAQETGILLQWLKAEGDEVTKGEPLMEIETDKAAVEVDAPASGTLAQVTAGPGDEVPVGQVIGLILAPGEEIPADAPATAEPAAVTEPAREIEVAASPLAARIAAEHDVDLELIQPDGDRIRKEDVLAYVEARRDGGSGTTTYRLQPASPKARRLAAERNLRLAEIKGTGPDGAVVAADVQAVAASEPVASTPISSVDAEALPVSRMWQVMAQRITASWTSVPHFYLAVDVNASRLRQWRAEVQQRVPQKVTLTDLLIKLVAVALNRHPRLNARWENGTIYQNRDINIGLAVAVEDGLLVPVIPQADRQGIGELATRRQELVSRAQAGKLTPAEMGQGTFTISNLGMFGIDAFNAIVNPPEAAILALGRIAERVVPVNGQPAVQPMLTMTLSCDHRVVDGARGARFLQTLVSLIEDPLAILD